MKLLVINPGSTSTKVTLFEDETPLFEESVFHDAPQLLQFPNVNDQMPYRRDLIIDMLRRRGYEPADIDVFIGRGGSAQPQPAGVTEINELLYRDTERGVGGSDHPAKLGVMIAWDLGQTYGGRMYTLNPTNTDELCDEARLTGIKGVYRNAQSHALNQKAVAAFHARSIGKRYEDCNFVVAHIDGGITVNAHDHGRMVDGNVGSGGNGAFSPTRIGSIPVLPLLDFIESHSVAEVRLMCSRAGGFVSYFGTSNAATVHKMVEANDPRAALIWRTMIYGICKQIGSMACVLKGQVDGILLTGGLMRYQDILDGIRERCGWIAPITVYPGEMEQEELAGAVLRALHGEEPIHRYTGRPVFDGFGDLDL